MDYNAYQMPIQNEVFVQQNLFTSVHQRSEQDSIGVFFNQILGFKKINSDFVMPLTTELGLELNHSLQTSFFCTYTTEGFLLSEIKNVENIAINNFWYCGNAFAYVPVADSVVHPNLKVYTGAGQAYGSKNTPGSEENISLNFWTIKPTASVEVNIFQNFKFSLGAGYQFLFATQSIQLEKHVTGFDGHIALTVNLR